MHALKQRFIVAVRGIGTAAFEMQVRWHGSSAARPSWELFSDLQLTLGFEASDALAGYRRQLARQPRGTRAFVLE